MCHLFYISAHFRSLLADACCQLAWVVRSAEHMRSDWVISHTGLPIQSNMNKWAQVVLFVRVFNNITHKFKYL